MDFLNIINRQTLICAVNQDAEESFKKTVEVDRLIDTLKVANSNEVSTSCFTVSVIQFFFFHLLTKTKKTIIWNCMAFSYLNFQEKLFLLNPWFCGWFANSCSSLLLKTSLLSMRAFGCASQLELTPANPRMIKHGFLLGWFYILIYFWIWSLLL